MDESPLILNPLTKFAQCANLYPDVTLQSKSAIPVVARSVQGHASTVARLRGIVSKRKPRATVHQPEKLWDWEDIAKHFEAV